MPLTSHALDDDDRPAKQTEELPTPGRRHQNFVNLEEQCQILQELPEYLVPGLASPPGQILQKP